MRYQRKPFFVDATLYQPGMEDCWLVLDSGCVRQHIANTKAEAEGWLERHGHMAERIVPGLKQGLTPPVRIKEGDYIVSPDKGQTFVMTALTFKMLYEPME